MKQGEYAEFVDYTQIKDFKSAMVQMGQGTVNFPRDRWNVSVDLDGYYHYSGGAHDFKNVTKGLGNKNWIASWMERYSGLGRSFHDHIGADTMLMAINDGLPGRPVSYTDEVASGRSDWFEETSEGRIKDLIRSYARCCERNGVALLQGESPALRFLVNTVDHEGTPVDFHCPSFSGAVTVLKIESDPDVKRMKPGLVILGAASSEWHCNGASLIIKRAMALPDKFMTKLPNGNTLGEQALTETRSYVGLLSGLLKAGVDIHGVQPITGGGISKLTGASKADLTYHIQEWPFEIPLTCQFMREIGVSFFDCITTFNWGIGYAVFVPDNEVNKAIDASLGQLRRVGVVSEGPRQVVYHPADDMILPPQGD